MEREGERGRECVCVCVCVNKMKKSRKKEISSFQEILKFCTRTNEKVRMR